MKFFDEFELKSFIISYTGSIIFLISLLLPWVTYYGTLPPMQTPEYSLFGDGIFGFEILSGQAGNWSHFIEPIATFSMIVLVAFLLIAPIILQGHWHILSYLGFFSLLFIVLLKHSLSIENAFRYITDTGYHILIGVYVGFIGVIVFIISNILLYKSQIPKHTQHEETESEEKST